MPHASAAGAAMKATSIFSSPDTIARARPPCVCKTAGTGSCPRDTACATGPAMYAEWMAVTTPSRMWSTIGAWAGNNELAATVMSWMPIAAISASTMLMTKSPLRRWWWKEMVPPSFRPAASMAARRPGMSLEGVAFDVWNLNGLIRPYPSM
ncbi:hypothetical protein AYR66_04015 [Noviherbaspirillum denitrificans]|uniref:Uncharacterized protein n=1 Tax=Noviherbaspirillum denitrificans TaxID=1968433 RepID=A0A254T7X3_9BURK|nr:hypothetical protein AYR66_04015 [Noviherbaspirillum denitrificans]